MLANPLYVTDRRAGRICTQHGEVGTPLNRSWQSARKRCYNPKIDSYKFYGGRGIKMHSAWAEYKVFAAEVRAEIGDHPGEGYQLDRIDSDGDYAPGNIKWSTFKENCRNRRNNRTLTFQGRTQCMSAWTEELGWPKSVLETRLGRGWTVERALTTPPRNYPRL